MDIIDLVALSIALLSLIVSLFALKMMREITKVSLTSQLLISELYEVSKFLHYGRSKLDSPEIVKNILNMTQLIQEKEFVIKKCGLGEVYDKMKASIKVIQKLGPLDPKAVEEVDEVVKLVFELADGIEARLNSIFSNPFINFAESRIK